LDLAVKLTKNKPWKILDCSPRTSCAAFLRLRAFQRYVMSGGGSRIRSPSPPEREITADSEDDGDIDFNGQESSEGGKETDSEDDVPLNLRTTSRFTSLSESDRSDSEEEAPEQPQKKRKKTVDVAKKFDKNWFAPGVRKTRDTSLSHLIQDI